MNKLENSFEYACEESRKAFQANINSLLELHGHFQTKRINSLTNKKDGVFITNEGLRTIADWILDIAGSQMGHYLTLEGVNRKTNKLFKCALKLQEREQETPNLKKILA